MKKNNKALLTLVCAILLVVATVFGTLAYFTDQDTVVNTFTVGKVDIELNESDVDKDGSTKENAYHLIPGLEYEKDPKVTVNADSEESYIRIQVTCTNLDALKAAFPAFINEADGVFMLQYLVKNWDPQVWEFASFKNGVYEFRYHTTVSTVDAAAKDLEPLFTHVVVPSTADNADMAKLPEGIQIKVVAHAIQAAGFADANAAWAAFDVQHAA